LLGLTALELNVVYWDFIVSAESFLFNSNYCSSCFDLNSTEWAPLSLRSASLDGTVAKITAFFDEVGSKCTFESLQCW